MASLSPSETVTSVIEQWLLLALQTQQLSVVHATDLSQLLRHMQPILTKKETRWLPNTHVKIGLKSIPMQEVFRWKAYPPESQHQLAAEDPSLRWQRMALMGSLIRDSLETTRATCLRVTGSVGESSQTPRIKRSSQLFKRVAQQCRRERSTLEHQEAFPMLKTALYTNSTAQSFTLNGVDQTTPETMGSLPEIRRYVPQVNDSVWERLDGKELMRLRDAIGTGTAEDVINQLLRHPEMNPMLPEMERLELQSKRLCRLFAEDRKEKRDFSNQKGSGSLMLIPANIGLPVPFESLNAEELCKGLTSNLIPFIGVFFDDEGHVVPQSKLFGSEGKGSLSDPYLVLLRMPAAAISSLLEQAPSRVDLCSTPLL